MQVSQDVLHATYLLVQIFIRFEDLLPLDLYYQIEKELRKLYYCDEKNLVINDLQKQIDNTLYLYKKEKKARERRYGKPCSITLIMPMRIGMKFHPRWDYDLPQLLDHQFQDIYYINSFVFMPHQEYIIEEKLNHVERSHPSFIITRLLAGDDRINHANKLIREEMDKEEKIIKGDL